MAGNATADALIADRSGPAEGPDDADVTIIVYTDYQCPACRRSAPAMRNAARTDGRTRIRYRDFAILGPRSDAAARVALASVWQGRYADVHHGLMAEPRRLDGPVLRDAAIAAGCNWDRIERDLVEHGDAIDAMLARIRGEAFALGIEGTPAFVIGRTLYFGAMGEGQFARAIAAARNG